MLFVKPFRISPDKKQMYGSEGDDLTSIINHHQVFNDFNDQLIGFSKCLQEQTYKLNGSVGSIVSKISNGGPTASMEKV